LSMVLKALGIEVISMCPGDTKTNFTKNRIKDFSTTERYGDMLETATLASDAKEDKRMTVEYVAEKIFKLVNKKKCKPFYIIGGKYKFLYFLTRLTPKSLLLNCTAKKKGGVFKKAEPKVKKVKEKPTTEVVAEEVQNVEDIVEANEVEQVEVVEENKETETKPSLNNILSKITVLNKSEAKSEEENSEGVVEKTEPEVVEASKSEDVEVNAENSGESEVVAEVKEEESKEKETDEANEEKKKDQ